MNIFIEYLKKNRNQLLAISAAFLTVGLLLNSNVFDFEANLFATKKSAPFNGTVTPVQKIPSWIDLSPDQWKMPYSSIPTNKFIDLPEYQPTHLAIATNTLNYSKPSDRAIRNEQVTYSVPYMGDYKLDGLEYVGSHLAVDLKVPTGTPVYAIANAVVLKAENQPGGFGMHVVLRHDEVPSISDASVKTTYYSGYGHMSKLMVTAGDLVVKGQQIGESGATGTATTPHVHFQIDNDQAPWHLYWPFTGKEASDAGLGFFEAINAGLGRDKAMATTISPMAYVQKYKSFGGTSNVNSVVTTLADQLPPANTPTSPTLSTPVVSNPISNVVSDNTNNSSTVAADQLPPFSDTSTATNVSPIITPVVNTVLSKPVTSFQLKYDAGFVKGAEKIIKVLALDDTGSVISDFKPEGEVSVKLDSGSATLTNSYLKADDFIGGIANISFTPTASYGIKVSINYNAITASTEVMQESGFTDVGLNSEYYVAVNFLRNFSVVKGYPDGSFKPDSDISRVESLKFIYEGLHKDLISRNNLEFSDTDSSSWYAKYVATAQSEGIVRGYALNLFKPANPVTKAEFVKMLVVSAGFDASNYVASNANYSDVDSNAWYANYIALAKDKNLLDTNIYKFNPNDAITRAEVAQILYKTIVMKANDKFKYDSSLVVNDDLAKQFYNI